MQTKNIGPVSDPTLTKLLAVDSDLAAQEAQLIIQLQDIQAKRKSLELVISLFTVDDTQAAPATKTTEAFPAQQVAVTQAAARQPKGTRRSTSTLASSRKPRVGDSMFERDSKRLLHYLRQFLKSCNAFVITCLQFLKL